MDNATFSLAVSVFTLGGLAGSLVAGKLADRHGRRNCVYLANVVFLLAGLVEALASSPGHLFAGRLLAGLASGVGVVVVPTYLAEVAPIAHRGLFGALHQLGVVCGILFTQVLGLFLSYVPGWRVLLGISAVPAGVQLAFLSAVVRSPVYLARTNRLSEARASLLRLRGPTAGDALQDMDGYRYHDDRNHRDLETEDEEVVVRSPLAAALVAEGASPPFQGNNALSVREVLKRKEYRRSLAIVLLLFLTQQLSGINAVAFYSTAIMSSVFPGRSALVTVSISVVNALMTLPGVYLVDRSGRRPLFLASLGSMCAVTACLALAMSLQLNGLSSLSIVLFVATFSVGLGPIPFLMTSEVFDAKAVSSASSIGLSASWVSNFVVGAAFLPLTDALGGNSAAVFLLFALVQLSAFLVARRILPETKGKSAEQVMSEMRW